MNPSNDNPAPRIRQAPLDLLDLPGAGRFLRRRDARALLQLPLLIIALLMVYDGFVGPQSAPENAATVLSWIHFRGLVVLGLLVAGNLFCMGCPFMLVRNWSRRFLRPRRAWPRLLRNKWPAVAAFAAFLFAYELFDLWSTPWWTAWIIVLYFVGCVAVDSIFRGATFCKYLCPVGQFNFLGSLVSPLEVKVRRMDTCETCRTRECIQGGEGVRGCELWLFQRLKTGNMDCTFCLDCIHSCPHDNVGISARLPGSELSFDGFRSGIGRFFQRRDLAALVTVFSFGALLNAFSMISPVHVVEGWLSDVLSTSSEGLILGAIFSVGLIAEPLILLTAAAWVSRRWSRRRKSLLGTVNRYVYALVPVGFGIWTAHYAFHFLTGLWGLMPVVRRLSLSLGVANPLSSDWFLQPLLPRMLAFPLEVGVIGLGSMGSLLAAYEIARTDLQERWWQTFTPWAALALLMAGTGVWLMSQPMEMRGTMWMG